MAYAALVSLQHVLEQISQHDDEQDSPVLGDHRQQIKSLHENIIFLVGFLDDFPKEAGAELEERIRDAVNQAEDLIEGQISDEMRSGHNRDSGVRYFTQQAIMYFVRQVIYRADGGTGLELHKKLQSIMKEVETIVEEVTQIKSSRETKDPILSHFHASSSSGLTSSGKGNAPVGLEEDLLKIIGRLDGQPSNLEIIPIIGMGGIGKTTLAQCAYDSLLSVERFDVRAWVTVSQDYAVKEILLDILLSLSPSTDKGVYAAMSKEKLLEHLYKFLMGRRYLIAMDDVWDMSIWDDLRRTFPNNSNGSRIMITSRHLDVASYVDPSNDPHLMNLMDVHQSWNLLKEKVFAQENCPPELEQIGKFIAEKCKGLPLTIVVIAGILSKANPIMHETWVRVAESIDEGVNIEDGNFTELLSLSYRHLPHYLKPCFLYMGGFPKDYEIRVSKLIKLWVADGFLRVTRSKSLDKVAEGCLKDLIERSLVLVVKKKSNGNIKTVKIHDLLRDLCIKIAEDEKFLLVVNKQSGSFPKEVWNSRRLSTSSYVLGKFRDGDGSSIRTILSPLPGKDTIAWNSFQLLRVLDVNVAHLTYFPVEIGYLFHLRYLALIASKFKNKFTVLESLSSLQDLQTLIIMSSNGVDGDLYVLPFGTWRFPKLMHLVLFNACLPDLSVGALTTYEKLRTLARVSRFICSEWIVKLVPDLNKLKIVYMFSDLAETAGWSEYKLKNLVHFHVLEKLNIRVDRKSQENKYRLNKFDIVFPVSLKKLTLRSCRLRWRDLTVIGSLPNLEVLKLRDNAASGDSWATNEDEFCRLRVLVIHGSNLRQWESESTHFPKLQSLYLSFCEELEKIPDSIGEIDTLQLIEVHSCSASIEESAKCIEEEQRSYGNYELHVRIFKPDPNPRGFRKREEALKRRSVFRHNQRWLE